MCILRPYIFNNIDMDTRNKKRRRDVREEEEITTFANEIVNDMTTGKEIAKKKKDEIVSKITEHDADLVGNNENLVDELARVQSNKKSVPPAPTPPRAPETHMDGSRPPGSATVLKIMQSRLLKNLGIDLVDKNTTEEQVKRQVQDFIENIANELTLNTHQTVGNDKVQKFLYKHMRVNVNRGDVRPCVTMKIGDMQQMKDVWGRQVTEYAKGMGSQIGEKAKCYLCGMNIVPFGSCPEMEHKYPATTAYSRLHHYRLLQVYKGNQDGDNTKSMYTLWKEFVNNNLNQDELINLYRLINHVEPYNEEHVDSAYRTIFNNFWRTTRYYIDSDPISAPAEVTDGDKAETDNEINQRMYNFLYYFIKSWLMEFAYSHHICNQAKSDIGIWENDGEMNKFITHATNKAKPKNNAGDVKANTESTQMQGRLNTALRSRSNRTNSMFQDLNTTANNYKNNYRTVSRVIVSHREDAMRVTEAMVMLKALYYVTNSASDTTEGLPAENPSVKISKENHIQELYKELLEKERIIFEMETDTKRETVIKPVRKHADSIRVRFENARSEYINKYNEDPIDVCMSKCADETNEGKEDSKTLKLPGPGGTRRRRPRSKRRRVSKKKKTRKRRARKMVSKRRKKV